MNNFREWLSDNLRYIMLGLGILLVLVAMFFGVRAVSARISASREGDVLSMDSVVSSAEVDQKEAAVPAAATESVVSAAENPASSDSIHGPLETGTVPAVSELMTAYYEAVGSQNISAVRELVDVLPETKAASISSERLVYSDVEAYTKQGPQPDSYVVYTKYSYSNPDSEEKLPGISQSYVVKGEDGKEKIVFSELDAETKNYIDAVARDADVVQLISSVRDEYNAARAALGTGSSGTASGSAANSTASVSATQETSGEGSDDEAGEDTSYDDEEASEDDGEASYDEENYDEEDDSDNGSEENYDEEDNSDDGSDEEYSEEEESSSEDEEWTGKAVSQVNVRSGPGFDYEVIAELSEGQEVTISGDDVSGWYHVFGDGIDGYVGHSWIE